jgi:hypothetical protein
MANRERGEIGVEVDGKGYTLRPTFDAICEYEILTGKAPEEFFQDMERGTFHGLRASVWCLLQDEHGEEIRTLKHASEWIERAGGVDVVMAHLAQLWEWNTEPTTGASDAHPPTAQAGTGKRSSSRRARSA